MLVEILLLLPCPGQSRFYKQFFSAQLSEWMLPFSIILSFQMPIRSVCIPNSCARRGNWHQCHFFRGDMSAVTGWPFLLASVLPRYQPWRTQSRLTLVSIATWDSIQNPPSMCPPASFLLQSGKSGRCPRRRCWTRHLPNTRQPIKGLAKHTKC